MTNILINLHKRAAGIDLRGSVARFGIDPYFRFTVDTTEAGSASGTFVLPTIGAGYDATVDWGDGTTTELIGSPGNVTKVYSEAKEYQISITGTFPRIYFNNGGDRLKLKSIDNWGNIQWQSFERAFYGCSNLVTAHGIADTSAVMRFDYAFNGCSSLQTLDVSGWNTEKVKNFQEAFRNCSILKGDFSSLSIKAATNLFLMFSNSNINAPGTTTNYDLLLNSFRAQAETYSKTGLNFYGGTAKYSAAAQTARDELTTETPTGYGWSITDGGLAT